MKRHNPQHIFCLNKTKTSELLASPSKTQPLPGQERREAREDQLRPVEERNLFREVKLPEKVDPKASGFQRTWSRFRKYFSKNQNENSKLQSEELSQVLQMQSTNHNPSLPHQEVEGITKTTRDASMVDKLKPIETFLASNESKRHYLNEEQLTRNNLKRVSKRYSNDNVEQWLKFHCRSQSPSNQQNKTHSHRTRRRKRENERWKKESKRSSSSSSDQYLMPQSQSRGLKRKEKWTERRSSQTTSLKDFPIIDLNKYFTDPKKQNELQIRKNQQEIKKKTSSNEIKNETTNRSLVQFVNDLIEGLEKMQNSDTTSNPIPNLELKEEKKKKEKTEELFQSQDQRRMSEEINKNIARDFKTIRKTYKKYSTSTPEKNENDFYQSEDFKMDSEVFLTEDEKIQLKTVDENNLKNKELSKKNISKNLFKDSKKQNFKNSTNPMKFENTKNIKVSEKFFEIKKEIKNLNLNEKKISLGRSSDAEELMKDLKEMHERVLLSHDHLFQIMGEVITIQSRIIKKLKYENKNRKRTMSSDL